MQVIFVVLNKIDCLDDLLARLNKAGIRGGTIIDSKGMVRSIDDSDQSYILGSLKFFLDTPSPESKTIFFLVRDDQVEIARKTVDEVLGGIDKPNTGVMFGMPVTFVDGIKQS